MRISGVEPSSVILSQTIKKGFDLIMICRYAGIKTPLKSVTSLSLLLFFNHLSEIFDCRSFITVITSCNVNYVLMNTKCIH